MRIDWVVRGGQSVQAGGRGQFVPDGLGRLCWAGTVLNAGSCACGPLQGETGFWV